MTESRLNDLCRRFANRPPKRLIFDRLLREAKRMLLFSACTVHETAYSLGFKDPAYFARFFNRLEGCSPRPTARRNTPFRNRDHSLPRKRQTDLKSTGDCRKSLFSKSALVASIKQPKENIILTNGRFHGLKMPMTRKTR